MGSIAPVTKLDASDAKNIAGPFISSGFPKRPMGIPPLKVSSNSGTLATLFRKPSFQTCAGKMAFTRTPREAHSVDHSRVICITAPIAIPYGVCPRPREFQPPIDPKLMIDPLPCSNIRRPASWQEAKRPTTRF